MSENRIVVRTTRVAAIKVKTGGAPGARGPTAYQVAVANGFVGSEAAWLLSLQVPAALPAEPTDLEITTGTAPGIFSWSVLKAKFAFRSWIEAWKAASLGTAAVANVGDFDAAGAAGAVQGNLNDHTGALAPHFDLVSQAAAEAGTSEALAWWSPVRIKQAILALGGTGGGSGWSPVARLDDIAVAAVSFAFPNVFTDAYSEYRVRIENATGTASSNAAVAVMFGYGVGPTWLSSGYKIVNNYLWSLDASQHTGITPPPFGIPIGYRLKPAVTTSVEAIIQNARIATKPPTVRSESIETPLATTGTLIHFKGSGYAGDVTNKMDHLMIRDATDNNAWGEGATIIIEGRNP